MRIIIDIQGMQTRQSRNRGVGRYISEIIKEFLKIAQDHQVILIANDNYGDTKASLVNTLGRCNIAFWKYCDDLTVEELQADRERFILSFNPDLVYMLSLQEGFHEKTVASISKPAGSKCVWVTNLPDVIPILFRDQYLKDPTTASWYDEKILQTKKSDYIITVSEFSKDRISELLPFNKSKIFIIPPAVDKNIFKPKDTLSELGQYILFVSGYNPHKNIERLIQAYSIIPEDIRSTYKLVLIGNHLQHNLKDFLSRNDIQNVQILEGISDDELVNYYKNSSLFVFPSYGEGFGIPPLEAMACGIPTITSNAHSLPEVTANPNGMFNPFDTQQIANMIHRGLTDTAFRQELINSGLEQANRYTWEKSAKQTLQCLESIYMESQNTPTTTEPSLQPCWHTIKFPDGTTTPGLKSYELLCQEATNYFSGIDLTNKSVLDIGAWDGFMSFESERRGASRVLAVEHDSWSGPGWGTKDTFNYAHKKLNSKVESLDSDLFDLDPQVQGKFDVVLLLGVIYHLTDPYGGLKKAADMTNNLLIVESTAYQGCPDEPVMRYHLGSELCNDPSNFWSPNALCLRNMLTEIGFTKIEILLNEDTNWRLVAKAWK